ncbi:endonuclease I family protein [Streptomyces althioticus]|uniref:endonuclease I family protein n=1 Tax=Streptomyces althioticus TaxID=83380 RepID=UPI0036AB3DD8
MPAVRIRRRKAVALASAAVLAGLAVPALTPATAGASAPAHETPAAQARVAAVADYADYADYYEGAEGKTGEALKSALNSIISDQTKLSYSAVWDALKETDEDPSNSGNVILLYSGVSRSKSANGGNTGDWNREHVWAKSHGDFGTSTGPGTDIHHLRPSDVQVNSIRGNKDFDNGGSAVANGGGSLTDSDSFEPRDAVKGDVARMILYMAVRYEGTDGWPDLEPNNSVSNGSAPYIGKLSVLKEWHEQDPPDSFEQRRNDVIFESFQHNRNPFIDHPEWVESIW